MSDIFGYIEKYKSCTFDIEEFNDIDNLVLSRLAYIDFNNCTDALLKDAAKIILNNVSEKQKNKMQRCTYRLLEMAGKSLRYGNIIISDFTNETDDSKYSFSAVTFKLSGKTSYIAFRGTDDSMASIYEDVAMSNEFPILSQTKALDYIKNYCSHNSDRFYIGGYSKGGNLALFSYVFASETIRDRIIKVYNNDGPGFPKEYSVLYSDRISFDKVKFIAPKDSIVGRLMFFNAQYTIVESKAHLIKQHNVFTWKTENNKLKNTSDFSLTSDILDNFISSSLNSIDSDELSVVNFYMNNIIDKFNLSHKQDIDTNVFFKIVRFTLKNKETLIPRKLLTDLSKAIAKGFVSTLHQLV